jgi:ubiquinone/menaquinone biosynthesis C-methylase UbiE
VTAVLWVIGVLLAIVVVARLRSRLAPSAFPPWLTPILAAPYRNRTRILERAGLRLGERVLEIGPGAGWITERAVERLGDSGRLVCLDLQSEMLRKVRNRLGARTPALVQASGSRLPFRDGAFDRAFLIHVLGEIPDKPAAVAELHRVIRSGGELAVEEGLPDPDYIRTAVLGELVSSAGFRTGERFGGWADYTQRFSRL